MPSDTVVSIGGHTLHFSSLYLWLIGMLLLALAGFAGVVLLGLAMPETIERASALPLHNAPA